MSDPYYQLPPDLSADIDAYGRDVQRFRAGELPAALMKAKRVPRGVYEQRQDGTYMVRVRVAGGTLTPEQTRELAVLAADFGDGLLHVTTRQDVQLHSVAIEDTPPIMRRLMRVGLTSKGGGGNTVRNVTACPFAGVCPNERFDVTPCAHAVTEYLIPLVGSYNLPRKYKIAFSGCAADCALAQVSDLGFVAEMRNGTPGFRVVAGGGMGAKSRIADELLDWTPAAEIIRIAEAIRRLFDEFGDRSNKHRARLRFVFERLAAEEVRDRFMEKLKAVTDAGVPEWRSEITANKGRDQEGNTPGAPAPRTIDGVQCIRQRQAGFMTVLLHLPLGFLPAGDFAKIGEIAARFSAERGPRTTRTQNMTIRFVKRERLAELANALGALETEVRAPTALQRFVACAGASTCRLGLCLARNAARAGAEALDNAAIHRETLANLDIRINGCSNACGHQPIAPIGFFGVAQRTTGRLAPYYGVTLGGRCTAEGARLGTSIGRLPAKALPAFLVDLARDFEDGRRACEPFSTYIERVGRERFEKLLAARAETPDYNEHPEFYRDFGAEDDFSLAGRGAGECGSGVFEVIQADLSAARKAQEPFDILLPTVRALLVTRGVDARDPATLLREFDKHFIESGLVSSDFRPLLARAGGYTQGWTQALDGCEDAVAELLERVRLLYSTLDANLQFHPPEVSEGSGDAGEPPSSSTPSSETTAGGEHTEAPAVAGPGAFPELDLRGVPCPMNFVKAKLRLEGMDAGESLAILLDDGEPIQNVPASFRNEGQTIEETTDLGDGHWRVVVRKQK